MPKKKEYALGIDLGGTKTLASVVDITTGEVISSARKRTRAERGQVFVAQRMTEPYPRPRPIGRPETSAMRSPTLSAPPSPTSRSMAMESRPSSSIRYFPATASIHIPPAPWAGPSRRCEPPGVCLSPTRCRPALDARASDSGDSSGTHSLLISCRSESPWATGTRWRRWSRAPR